MGKNIQQLIEQLNRSVNPADAMNSMQQLLTEHLNEVQNDSIPYSEKKVLEQMLNNTLKNAINESAVIGAGAMQNVINFMLPVVRKLMPALISRNLLPTYPLDMPEGKIRFLRYYRGDGKEPFKNTGEVLPEHYKAYEDPDAYAFSQTYASNDLIDYVTVTGPAVGGVTTTAYADFHVSFPEVSLLPVHPENDAKRASLYKFTVTDPDGHIFIFNADDFNFSDTGSEFKWEILSTSFTVSDGGTSDAIDSITVTLIYDATDPNFGTVTVTLGNNSNVAVTVSFYMTTYINQENLPGASINLRMEYYDLKTESRKLSTHISIEAFMLASKGHRIDIDNEMVETTSMLATFEMDRWIVGELYNAAITLSPVTHRTFDAKLPTAWITGPQQYYMFLIDAINKQSAEIYRRSLRGQAKWIVTSPEIYAMLALTGMISGINEYEKDNAGQLEMGGKLAHKYEVYIDPYFGSRIMLGHNTSDNSLNTGAVFAPFVPLAMLPPDYRSVNMTFNYGLYTKAAVKVFDPACYGVITVTNV